MDEGSKDGFLALLGLSSILYGLDMAFFTWRFLHSPYYAIFKPRWRFGIKASRGSAFVQAPLYLSLGGIWLFGAFHSRIAAPICTVIFFSSLALSVGIFFVDWGRRMSPNKSFKPNLLRMSA